MNKYHPTKIKALLSVFVCGIVILGFRPQEAFAVLKIIQDTTLTKDVFEPIEIGGDSLILDCAGHSVIGGGSGFGIISFSPHRSNIAIKNCTVENFDVGIYAPFENGVIQNNLVRNNTTGIIFFGSNNIVSDNEFLNNNSGILLTEVNSTNNSIVNNKISGSFRGIAVVGAGREDMPGNTIADNSLSGGGISGFLAKNIRVIRNKVRNAHAGIIFGQSHNILISGNDIDSDNLPFSSGILATFDTGNFTIENNHIEHADFSGIFLTEFGHEVRENTITSSRIGLNIRGVVGGLKIFHNNIFQNIEFNVAAVNPIELSFQQEGNFWGRTSPPCFVAGVDSNGLDVVDSFPFCEKDGWKKPREPVVIVPGIMGTRLIRVSDGVEVWPNIDKMFSPLDLSDSYLNDLKLSTTGQQIIAINSSEVIQEESILSFTRIFYKDLIDNFLNQGYAFSTTLFTVPYDWRLDITDEIARLNEKVQKAIANSSTGKVNIIVHSLGGLLVKEYLATVTSTDFLNKLILAGVPQFGAPKVFKLLNYGDDLGIKWFIFGLNQDKVKEISQNMPAVYQLLPSRKYVGDSGPYVFDFRSIATHAPLVYDETKQFMIDGTRNALLLNEADSFHGSRDTINIPFNQIYSIVGCRNVDTIGAFRIYDSDKFELGYVDGDGTVPFVSSNTFSNARRTYFADSDHLDLIKNTSTLVLINNIINDNPDAPISSISQSANFCLNTENTIVFIARSPVLLHIFDSQNRHTGPSPDGGALELQIPGSSYEIIENNRFARVPTGDTYRIVLDATASGSVDFVINSYRGLVLENRATYLDIPLQSDQTESSLTFTNIQADLPLNVDNEGDGIVDKVIHRNAILSSIESVDVTPPIITLPNIPSEVILNTALTLTFGVTDDISGLAILKATLDGNHINSGETVTVSRLGEHAFRIEAVDRAGNPRVQELKFKVIYKFSGFLSPLQKELRIFQIGRTIPIKFQLRDVNDVPISTASALLYFASITDGSVGNFQPGTSVGQSNTGNQFRFDSQAQQYIFNWDTKSLLPGTYRLRVDLDDGTSKFIDIKLRDDKTAALILLLDEIEGLLQSLLGIRSKI